MNDPPSFSLLDEPWILVRTRTGPVRAVGLRDAVVPNDDVVAIVGEVPTQGFAILRLLLAILHRSVNGPRHIDEWSQLLVDPAALRARVDSYLEPIAHRFDLRHPTAPFYQVAGLRTAKGEHSGLEKLIADVPNGQPQFTTRLGASLERISWAEAARWLVHVHAFDPAGIRSGAVGDPRTRGGRGYPIGPGWSGQIGGVHLEGRNLRETLMLNMAVPAFAGLGGGLAPIEADLPPWERDPDGPQENDLVDPPRPSGPVDLYTWQTRRVLLVGDDEGVFGVVLAQGDRATPQNRQNAEPMTSWRFSEPQTKKHGLPVYMPRLHDPARSYWRGLEAVLPHLPSARVRRTKGGETQYRPPGLVIWSHRLVDAVPDLVPAAMTLRAVGIHYGAQNSVIEDIIDDSLVLPRALLHEDADHLRVAAVDGVDRAQEVATVLANLASNLEAAVGAADTEGARARVREAFYARVDGPFRAWIGSFSMETDELDAGIEWERTLDGIAQAAAQDLLRELGPAAFVGRTVKHSDRHVDLGLAERWFWTGLDRALPHARRKDKEQDAS